MSRVGHTCTRCAVGRPRSSISDEPPRRFAEISGGYAGINVPAETYQEVPVSLRILEFRQRGNARHGRPRVEW
eukprot:4262264-Alexandrium_andersonii.AAC.1